MRTVKVKKSELVSTLKTNSDVHVREFNKAMEGYWRTAEREVEKLLDRVRNKRWDQPYQIAVSLTRPECHLDEYNTALEMLEWSTEDEVELTQQEFKQFVQDEWSWKEAFAQTTQMYAG